MIDYHGFWQGFIGLFVILPVVVGGAVGAFWAWHKGRRGAGLITAAILGGAMLSLCVFAIAVLNFGA